MLNRKLEGHVDSAGGFEPGLTLTDSSGNTAAVVVGSDLTLLAPAASDGAAPQATSAVASPPVMSEVAGPQAAMAKDPAVKEEKLDKAASEPAVATAATVKPTEEVAAKQEAGEAKPDASTSASAFLCEIGQLLFGSTISIFHSPKKDGTSLLLY